MDNKLNKEIKMKIKLTRNVYYRVVESSRADVHTLMKDSVLEARVTKFGDKLVACIDEFKTCLLPFEYIILNEEKNEK